MHEYVLYQGIPRRVDRRFVSEISGTECIQLAPLGGVTDLSAANAAECRDLTSSELLFAQLFDDPSQLSLDDLREMHSSLRKKQMAKADRVGHRKKSERESKPKAKRASSGPQPVKTRDPKALEFLGLSMDDLANKDVLA